MGIFKKPVYKETVVTITPPVYSVRPNQPSPSNPYGKGGTTTLVNPSKKYAKGSSPKPALNSGVSSGGSSTASNIPTAKQIYEEQNPPTPQSIVNKIKSSSPANKILQPTPQQPYLIKTLTPVEKSDVPKAIYEYVEPQGFSTRQGATGTKIKDYKRIATAEERKAYQDYEKSLSFKSGTASNPTPQGFLKTFYGNISKERYNLERANIKRQTGQKVDVSYKTELLGGFGGGVASAFVDTGALVYGLATNPTQTIKSVPASLKMQYNYITGGELTKDILYNPSKVGGYVAGIYALGKVQGGIKNYMLGDIVTTKPLRKLAVPEFLERQKTIVSGGKEFRLSTYDIIGETAPPRIKITTNRLRKALFNLPKDFEILPAKKFRIKTPEPAINNNPFLVMEIRQGSKVARLKQISGVSTEINPKIQKVVSPDEYLFKQYAEKLSNKPVSNIDKFFKKESLFESSDIQTRNLGSYNARTKKLSLTSNEFPDMNILDNLKLKSGKGRTTDLNRALTRTKEFLETNDIKVMTSESFFKDTTKPFSRATGKTPQLRGTIEIFKEPIILDTPPVNFITPANIKKTPLSKTFQLSELKQALKIIPKDVLNTLRKGGQYKTQTKIIPQTSKSSYAGLGLYELTQGGQVSRQEVRGLTLTKPSTIQINHPSQIEKNLKILKEVNKLIEVEKIINIQKLSQKAINKQIEVQKEIQIEKLIQKQQQKQLIKLMQKQIQKPQQTKGFLNLMTNDPLLFKSKNIREEDRKRRMKNILAYTIFLKRKGKFVPYASGLPRGLAMQKLEQGLKTTLARTGKIKQTGYTELPDINFNLSDDRAFRGYKVNRGRKIPLKNTLIQRSRYSLSSPEERLLIKQSRKNKVMRGLIN